eukprot:TRINITY_DN45010_c0_g1_i1.p1 TRINITY_DN45010_c0_g1~~TRINITY_DN45010_c0_g1_i1.p1  ORF type:complete len:308 (-),score=18.49 TRINITY_DN45010_c0_g1_i1:32-955(-)
MIHIYRACSQACEVSSRACTTCTESCRQAGGAVCQVCGSVCQGCTINLLNCLPCIIDLDRPLMWHSSLTWLLNAAVLMCACVSLADPSKMRCLPVSGARNPLHNLLTVDLVLAASHILFSIYLTSRLTARLDLDDSRPPPERPTAAPGEDLSAMGNRLPGPRDVLSEVLRLLLYDVGFCLYIVLYVFCFAWNCMGIKWLSSCTAETWPALCVILELLYVISVPPFAAIWSCSLACEAQCRGCRTALGIPAAVGRRRPMSLLPGPLTEQTAPPHADLGPQTTPSAPPPEQERATFLTTVRGIFTRARH